MYGQDSFSLQSELNQIRSTLGDPGMLAINTSVLDGKQLTLNEFQDNCNTIPFLHQQRLVIVEGLLGRFDSWKKPGKRTSVGQSKASAEMSEWEILGDYIEKMLATTVLILIDSDLNEKNNTLFKHSLKIYSLSMLHGESTLQAKEGNIPNLL